MRASPLSLRKPAAAGALAEPPRGKGEFRRNSLQVLLAPWQAQVNFVIWLLMIVLAGKGGVGACSCV